jgi:predicted Zn finger-like uncharacterized protein
MPAHSGLPSAYRLDKGASLMILTCPSCGTQYAVKDGAIPPQGRQVRCASCKHAWHQDPETGPGASPLETAEPDAMPSDDAPGGAFDDHGEPIGQSQAADYAHADAAEPAADPVATDPETPPGEALVEDAPAAGAGTWTPPPEDSAPPAEPAPAPEEPGYAGQAAYDEDFSPFTMEERGARRRRSPLVRLLTIALLIAALAAAFWFLAPAEWKERVGIAAAGETPLQLMMTHSDRQKLASGNELLAVSGRVINPTDEQQDVPPIRAQLRSSSGKLVYSWTIAPPARTLPPGASATFNSAEVNVPAGGDELTITLGSAKT